MKVTVIPIVVGALDTVAKGIGTETGGLVNKRTSRDNPNYRIIKTSQNTEKNPEDLRRLAVNQTQVKNHPLTLVEKNFQKRNR